jgi:hypothetical protein
MALQISPRLGRVNVVSNCFTSCISNTAEEFSWTPEVSFPEISPQPRMFLHQFESGVTFEQLQSSADTHSGGHFNKEMDVITSDMQFINFESMPVSNLSNKELTIHPNPIELKGVFGILRFPNKMESILPKAMLSRLQIHFFAPQTFIRNTVLTMSGLNLFQEGFTDPLFLNNSRELNFIGEGSPMFENMGILQM